MIDPSPSIPIGGVLARLVRDARGNVLPIMAAMLLPLAAFSGSAIDAARLYSVRNRLQQACDAGVLAGRRTMTLTGSTTLDSSDTGQAQLFFKNNFRQGWFKTAGVSFQPTLDTTNNHVVGAAWATVPMTIMAMFGQQQRTVTVACESQYDVSDADLMFVLDTTGSMACTAGMDYNSCVSYVVQNVVSNADGSYAVTEKSGSDAASKSRIQNLREAVASFYTTLTSLVKDPSIHFRFGFVPYNATVNMGVDTNGGLLPRSTLATTWNYQSRVLSDPINYGSPTTTTSTTTKDACNAKVGIVFDAPNTNKNYPYTGTQTTTVTWSSNGGSNGTCTATGQPVRFTYTYGKLAQPVAVGPYIATYGTSGTVANPAAFPGEADRTSSWNGCIEERSTTVTSAPSATSPPADLNVDDTPTASDPWGPMWGDMVYAHRDKTAASETGQADYRTPVTRFQGGGFMADRLNELPCPKQAQRLKEMTLSQIQTYLSAGGGFRPYGVTYHDVGMTWGTRLISPKGMFQGDTAAWPGHPQPNRYIIFLTDGQMETDEYSYASHGLEQWDKRVAGGNVGSLDQYHSSRFATACKIARDSNHQIKVYLIAYASSIKSLSTEMQNCANKSYVATDTAGLNAAFTDIAQQVAMLRLSK